jgi:hypothetical protein
MKRVDTVQSVRDPGPGGRVGYADFARRAQEVLSTTARLRGQWGLSEAVAAVMEQFVDSEAHAELRSLGLVLAMARRQALLQQQLDEDRDELHSGRLTHEELDALDHHYEMLRREACEYNHELRDLIEGSGHYFSRDELTGWMVEASQGRHQWARGEITGAISEVALHQALRGMPELQDLRYSTLAEDLAGFDFVAAWQGRMVSVDAKTGLYRPLSERKHGHLHLEISVPREAVKGFQVTHHGLNLLRQEVRQALHRQAGLGEHHSPHHFYHREHHFYAT